MPWANFLPSLQDSFAGLCTGYELLRNIGLSTRNQAAKKSDEHRVLLPKGNGWYFSNAMYAHFQCQRL
jgi:hypothetical protein